MNRTVQDLPRSRSAIARSVARRAAIRIARPRVEPLETRALLAISSPPITIPHPVA